MSAAYTLLVYDHADLHGEIDPPNRSPWIPEFDGQWEEVEEMKTHELTEF